jgi:hypothetical protein
MVPLIVDPTSRLKKKGLTELWNPTFFFAQRGDFHILKTRQVQDKDTAFLQSRPRKTPI